MCYILKRVSKDNGDFVCMFILTIFKATVIFNSTKLVALNIFKRQKLRRP